MTTNIERIKNMTVEEMVQLFDNLPMDNCYFCVGCPEDEEEINCRQYIKQWLQSESEEE